jgi:2-polyprenyl-3-methyl-5-hydroxy-6-metoxy-1,4-benzoquinol methylase
MKQAFRRGGFHYYRCRSCGLVATHPLPTDELIDSHYRAKFESGNYSLLREFAEEYRAVYEGFSEVLLKYVGAEDFSGVRVLDIGCFTGDFLVLLAEKGASVSGVELQEQAVEIANQRLPGRIKKADVHDDTFLEREYDIVTLTGLIEHVTDPVGLLRRVSKLLRPGGTVFLQTPDCASAVARTMGRFWPPFTPVEHIYLFSQGSLTTVLEEVGFESIRHLPHWKRLPVTYAYEQLSNFGREIQALAKPFYSVLPGRARRASIPFCIGEMMIMGRKRTG